jgi:glucose/arabinose dehydrogenase
VYLPCFELFYRLSIFVLLVFNFVLIEHPYSAYAKIYSTPTPIINDPNLKAELVFKGLNMPSSMAFLGPNDILVLEKNDGTVRRIVNGTMLPSPLLHVNVDNKVERGMLGIAVTKSKNSTGGINTYAFLYYSEKISRPVLNLTFNSNQSDIFSSYLNGSSNNCKHIFKCTVDPITASKDVNDNNKTSFKISTNTTNKDTWSSVKGKEIEVTPYQTYQLTTHMKLNQYAIQSHVALEAYNQTSKKWHQLMQCPVGTNGPLEWHEYSCEITIPANTTKIIHILNAGWSSQPGKQAVTLFDAIYLTRININDRLYRYQLINDNLVSPKRLLNLAAGSVFHSGGKIVIGPDKNLYIIIGDIDEHTRAANFPNVTSEDGTAGILRITQDGKPVGNGILGEKFPLNLYYGYGIRNGFGIDFDPLTGKLWDTENGPIFGDEINLVEPGFNSGWARMTGIWQVKEGHEYVNFKNTTIPNDLVTFDGNGKYRSPEFTWNKTVAPTGIKFLNSDKLGKQYQNDMFVGDFHLGNLYHFKLNQNRTGLLLNGALASKIATNSTDTAALKSIIFGHGFGGITDVQVGPDGYLYVVEFDQGKVYRIVPYGIEKAIQKIH